VWLVLLGAHSSNDRKNLNPTNESAAAHFILCLLHPSAPVEGQRLCWLRCRTLLGQFLRELFELLRHFISNSSQFIADPGKFVYPRRKGLLYKPAIMSKKRGVHRAMLLYILLVMVAVLARNVLLTCMLNEQRLTFDTLLLKSGCNFV
jgi:hypothetical protein